MDNKKIGLCLAYTGTNYGQLLQAYATQEILRKAGFQTEIIRYTSGRNKGIQPSFGAAVVAAKQLVKRAKAKLPRPAQTAEDALHRENRRLRRESADAFRAERLCDVVRCSGIDALREQSKSYFAVLVGSDQVWLPDVAVSNFYTLRFAAPGVRRISYATSLGVSAYPAYAKGPARDFWRRIDHLSVREETGRAIIRSIVDVPVEVVADPTYLFTREEWEKLIPERTVTEPGYALCYFLGDDAAAKAYARRVADARGLRLVSILSDECSSDDGAYADEVLIGKRPEDFVNLIRHADFVLTDSFHGLAFSVIHQKQVSVFYRKRTDVRQSRNSRIDNIVRAWGIEDRLIRDPEGAALPAREIDYAAVSERVAALRERSLAFLRRALAD